MKLRVLSKKKERNCKMNIDKLHEANNLYSEITELEEQINSLTIPDKKINSGCRIETNILDNNERSFGEANLDSKQKIELNRIVKEMLEENLRILQVEFKDL